MTDPKPAQASTATITAAEPQLFVSNIETSCRFFTDKLGFAIAFTYGSPPFYGQVVRDGARLNLRHVDQPVIDPDIRDREELLSASVTVETAPAIKQLFLEFQRRASCFTRPCNGSRGEPTTSLSRIPTATCCCSRARRRDA